VPKPPVTSNRRRTFTRWIPAIAAVLLVIAVTYLGWRAWPWFGPKTPDPLTKVVTLAGEGPRIASTGLSDPFGVAVGPDGAIFVTDGTGGRVFRIGADGALTQVAEGLDMPSAIAVLPDGGLVVANTGMHTIVRVDPASGAVTILAGAPGERGFADGPAAAARFDAPIGVASAPDGTIVVADTYNHRIRRITTDGNVTTVAGGNGEFDTPCGVAVAADGALIVADTANSRVVRIDRDGSNSVLAGPDGFSEPTGVAIGADGTILVADAGDASIWSLDSGGPKRLAGDGYLGRVDGEIANARFNRPTGVALAPEGSVVVADSVNGAVRAVVTADFAVGREVSDPVSQYDVEELRAAIPARWPYAPPDRTREIAATYGEARTENADDGVWLHNAIDIPGPVGEVVRAMVDERVTRPVAAIRPGDRSEFLRMPLFAYVHLRVGRDTNDRPLPNSPFEVALAEDGTVRRVTVRRGTRIAAGQAIGTLNKYGHVHLTMGAPGAEVNPLLVLRLPGFVDTVAPTIEEVTVQTDARVPIAAAGAAAPIEVTGRLRVLVRAWDRTDGNAERRRLGVFRLGYEVLDAAGARVAGESVERPTIAFDRLPRDSRGGMLAYASGSRSWFSGPTVFIYPVTNIVRDGEAREEFLDVSTLAPGDYTLRVFAEDASGNRTTRDVMLRKAP
jgi:glucose/arabinose dehydrogenase